ncbi:MAG: type 2 lanthipeptide synthetase LanM family protein, partial [Thermoanaerobaculia bacterium]
AFNGGAGLGRLIEARGGVSDPHRGERTVLLLRFDSGLRLVYKPKPLAADAAFQRLLLWLNRRGASPEFRPLCLLDRGTYGWVELIGNEECGGEDGVRRFYRRQGGYLALFYALGATDFHYENLLAAGEHPIPIDLETLFHTKPGEVGRVPHETLADAAAWDSVLRPGLLPQRIWAEDNAGVDISGLGAAPGQVTSVPVLQVEEGEDLIRFTRKVADLEVGSAHLPRLGGREAGLRGYGEDVASGFEAVYRLLVRHRDELLAPDGPLAAFAEAPIRILVRPTRIYAKLLAESFHPFVLQDALDRDRLLDRLWVDVEDRPGLARILPHEHRNLQRGDVPLFTSLPGSRALWTSAGERIPDVLPETGLESVRRIVLGLGEEDLDRQLRIVRGTLETLSLHEREPLWPGYPFAEREPVAAGRFLAAARGVGDRLAATAFRHAGSATWLGFSRQGASRFWSYEPVGHSLYSGVPGIALFLAYLGVVTGEDRYTSLAREAARTVCGQVDHNPGALTAIGGFSGWGGTLHALLHLGTLWGDSGLLDRAEALAGKLPGRIERDEDLDLVAGSAGCLLALLRLHAERPARRTLAAAALCGDRLLDRAREMEAGLGWVAGGTGPLPLTGLSHGAAGIAWALAELAAATGEERYLRACQGALAYERSLFSAAAGNWPDLRPGSAQEGREGEFSCGWCHGAPGIALARLACLPLLDDPGLRAEIDVAVATTWRGGLGGNHCLCHGDLGNLDVLLEAGRRLACPDLLARVGRSAAGILQGIEAYGWLTGAPLAPEIPGLMTGLAGIGYQLLRLAAVEEVPSVLLLEPPRLCAKTSLKP